MIVVIAPLKKLVLVIGVLAAISACAKKRSAPPRECCPCEQAPGKALDARLLSLLSAVRSYHHKADIHLRAGDQDKAVVALQDLLKLKFDPRWPEAEEARLDAAARLAKLWLQMNKEDAALKLVDEHLGEDARLSFYLANLHAVRGEILEQQSKKLDKEGEKEQSKAKAKAAIAALQRSIEINKDLQQRLSEQKELGK